jgi:very-short-patch-repair endonuclease
MRYEDALMDMARRQSGLVAKFQIHDLGLTCEDWRYARRSGRWRVLSPRLIAARASPESSVQRALAAVLDASPGGMLHGPSALAWWGIGGFNLAKIHVARPRDLSSCRSELASLHQLRDIRPQDVAVLRGVPTETPLRAIWVIAARYASRTNEQLVQLGVEKVGTLLDAAHRKGLVTWCALRAIVEAEVTSAFVHGGLAQRGRSGTVVMREASRLRPPGSSPTESRLEAKFEELIMSSGLPRLRRQVVVGEDQPIGRADFRGEDLPLVCEINSVTFHTTPSDREADEGRYLAYTTAGLTVAVIWEDDLFRRQRAVVETVRRACKAARRGEHSVFHSPSCPWPGRAPDAAA